MSFDHKILSYSNMFVRISNLMLNANIKITYKEISTFYYLYNYS